MIVNEVGIDLPLTPRSKTDINHYLLKKQEYTINTGANNSLYNKATIFTNSRRLKQLNIFKEDLCYITTIVREGLLIIFVILPHIRNQTKDTNSSPN